MEAAPAIQNAIDALKTSNDGAVRRLFKALMSYTGSKPEEVISQFEPEVVLLAWLLAAANAAGVAQRRANKSTQWNQQWLRASNYAPTLGGFLASGMGLSAVPAAGLNSVLFSLFSYFDAKMDVTPTLGQASFGAAYKALMITADLGYLVDNDLESMFLEHLTEIILYGQVYTKFSKLDMPYPTTGTLSTSWKRKWCTFVNDEFQSWIRAMFRVNVTVPRTTNVDGLVSERVNKCGSGTFEDLAAWQRSVRNHRSLLRMRIRRPFESR